MRGRSFVAAVRQQKKQVSQAQLDALHPHVVGLLPLQHLLEEDAAEAAGEGADHDADEAEEGVLVRRDRLRRGRFAAQLHKSHSGNDDHQGDPLSKGQLAIEEEDGEQSGGEDLHLVGYRVDCRVQMGDGHEKEIVLHCVKKGGNEQEESVLPLQEHFLEDDLAVRLAPEEYLLIP